MWTHTTAYTVPQWIHLLKRRRRRSSEEALLPFERWLEFYASIHRHSSSSGSSQEPSARANIEHSETSKTRFRLWCIYLYMCSATHRYSNADGHQLSEYANERSWMAYGAAHIYLYVAIYQSASQSVSQPASQPLMLLLLLVVVLLLSMYIRYFIESQSQHTHRLSSTLELLTAMYSFFPCSHDVCAQSV